MAQQRSTAKSTTFDDITQEIMGYLRERDWHRNDPRSLAISIVLESNELLEHYQWGDKSVGNKSEIAEELADILIYIFQFADNNHIDLPLEIRKKLEKVKEKYPAEKFKGTKNREGKSAWLEAKLAHKKKGL